MAQISRRQIAAYVAEKLLAGDTKVIDQLAAFLVAEKRTKEASLLVKDIEKALETAGFVVARAGSAFSLSDEQKNQIEQLLKKRYGAKQVAVKFTEDKDLLGGVVIETASQEFDGSLKRNINRLKALKV